MFQKTSPQLSLFDPMVIFSGILPADDRSHIYTKVYRILILHTILSVSYRTFFGRSLCKLLIIFTI